MLQARQLGNELVVGIHSDESILENKGPTVMTLEERYGKSKPQRHPVDSTVQPQVLELRNPFFPLSHAAWNNQSTHVKKHKSEVALKERCETRNRREL